MTGTQRAIKKSSIVLILLIIAFAIIWPQIRPKEDPCFNGVLDAGEKEIDCGGKCAKACPLPDKPPTVADINKEWAVALKDGSDNYDIVAKISNTNKHWGASSVTYKFVLYGANNTVIDTIIGNTYIVPVGYSDGQGVKYIIKNNYKSKQEVIDVKFDLYDFMWSEVVDILQLPELGVDTIIVKDKEYGLVESGSEYYYVFGVTENTSQYSFRYVDIYTVIYDINGKPIAAGVTDQNTVGAGSGWEFKLFWNDRFSGEPASVDYVAETNIFGQTNFMKDYGTGKKYIEKK